MFAHQVIEDIEESKKYYCQNRTRQAENDRKIILKAIKFHAGEIQHIPIGKHKYIFDKESSMNMRLPYDIMWIDAVDNISHVSAMPDNEHGGIFLWRNKIGMLVQKLHDTVWMVKIYSHFADIPIPIHWVPPLNFILVYVGGTTEINMEVRSFILKNMNITDCVDIFEG
jgi:hypothetical protein